MTICKSCDKSQRGAVHIRQNNQNNGRLKIDDDDIKAAGLLGSLWAKTLACMIMGPCAYWKSVSNIEPCVA